MNSFFLRADSFLGKERILWDSGQRRRTWDTSERAGYRDARLGRSDGRWRQFGESTGRGRFQRFWWIQQSLGRQQQSGGRRRGSGNDEGWADGAVSSDLSILRESERRAQSQSGRSDNRPSEASGRLVDRRVQGPHRYIPRHLRSSHPLVKMNDCVLSNMLHLHVTHSAWRVTDPLTVAFLSGFVAIQVRVFINVPIILHATITSHAHKSYVCQS